ncbi:2-oxo-4-hydroxy-4-carboxy-5-ureidoimidazoline decarboxylase [Corynebacterium sp. 335C]
MRGVAAAPPGLARLNDADPGPLAEDLTEISGSRPWADVMLAGRPYATVDALLAAADAAVAGQDRVQIAEAVAAHPPLGGRTRAGSRSEGEQSTLAGSLAGDADELARLNERYVDRHGHVFLLCAEGRTADEVLAAIRDRIDLDADAAWDETVEHLRRINRLRLAKYVGADPAEANAANADATAAGVALELTDASGELVASGVTDDDGRWRAPDGITAGALAAIILNVVLLGVPREETDEEMAEDARHQVEAACPSLREGADGAARGHARPVSRDDASRSGGAGAGESPEPVADGADRA